MVYENSLDFAIHKDEHDPLRAYRNEFIFPDTVEKASLYFSGNSLGLMPRKAKDYVNSELDDWGRYGVLGHTGKENGWLSYHELVTADMAAVVGGKPDEVVVMNTLTVNLHLMMVSFYRPSGSRRKIVIEKSTFPSDVYAVKSQIAFHGGDPERDLIFLESRDGGAILRTEDILSTIDSQHEEIALVMLGGVNYLSGQVYDIAEITGRCRLLGINVGFDLAHGAGNIPLDLHDWGVDFAVWCTYKYLNSGPGSIAGCFVHERNLLKDLPRFEGWWGTKKSERFKMKPDFEPIGTVESWQLSNPPILPLAALRASLEIFSAVGMDAIRSKSVELTGYLEFLLKREDLAEKCNIITPTDPNERGCQLSVVMEGFCADTQKRLEKLGVVSDFREPNVIRLAPAPLYNSFSDVYHLSHKLRQVLAG